MSDYRFLTPTDVDRFVQLPVALEVDARDAVLTVQENTMQGYDPIYMTKNCDYAIYCNIKKAQFFNTAMDWKYRMVDELNAPEAYTKFRFIATSLVAGSQWQVAELAVNGSASASGFITTIAASTTSSPAYSAAYVLDGSGSTTWASAYAGYSRDALSGLRSGPLLITVDAATKQHYVGEFLQVQLPAAVAVSSYTMRLSASGVPSDWHVMASNDGAAWRNIASVTGYVYASGATISDVGFPVTGNSTAYSYYRVVFSRVGANTFSALPVINDLRFYSVSAQTGATLTHPPNLTGVVTTISGQTEAALNGTYVATTSIIGDFIHNAWNAYDSSPTSYWAATASRYIRPPGVTTGTYDHVQLRRQTTDASSGAISYAEWLQIRLPAPLVLSGYDLRAAVTAAGRMGMECAPKDWLLMGSNDGSGWYVVDRRTGFDGWLQNASSTFDITSGNQTTPYSYYRIVIQRLVVGGSSAQAAIADWRLKSLDPGGGGGGAVLVFPPAPVVGELTQFTVSGQAAASQNGTYTLNASSFQQSTSPSGPVWYAFDASGGTAWRSTANRYFGPALFGGGGTDFRTQDVYFNSYRGDYIDVAVASPTVLQSYAFTAAAPFATGIQANAQGYNCPSDLVVLGSSDDGASWKLVDMRTGMTRASWPASLVDQTAVTFYPQYGRYAGVKLMDGHSPNLSGYVPLASSIMNADAAKAQLGSATDKTRFAHYKQCNQFFKYSFKVGDSVSVPVLDASGSGAVTYTDASGASWPISRAAQLYAVYLDSTWGTALPYWKTVSGGGADQQPEARLFYYADFTSNGVLDSVALGASGLMASGLVSTLDGPAAAAARVTVVAPPDPEFLESSSSRDASGASVIIGGSLAVRTDASGSLAVRRVGPVDASGNGLVQYGQANFAPFTADASRALVLYWLVSPPASGTADQLYPPYMGEQMFVAFSSQSMQAAAGGWRPIKDMYSLVTETYKSLPSLLSQGYNLEANKFALNRDACGGAVYSVRESTRRDWAGLQLSGAAPQLLMPLSRYFVATEKPAEADAPSATVPFAYGVLNRTNFQYEKLRSILGGRLLQLVSHYLFDAAGNREVGYFPYWLNESKQLTDKIIDALSALVSRATLGGSHTRTSLLRQIEVKYGRRYFDEYAVLNQVTNERIGDVYPVIQKINDLYVFFLVTLRTTVALRAKDDVEALRFEEIPVVLHLTD